MSQNGLAGPYGNDFQFLMTLHMVLHCSCTNFHSHQQCRKFFFLHTPVFICRHLMMTILTHMRWYLIAVLICISQIISDIEHLSMCLLARSSLEKCLFRSSVGLFLLRIMYSLNYIYGVTDYRKYTSGENCLWLFLQICWYSFNGNLLEKHWRAIKFKKYKNQRS